MSVEDVDAYLAALDEPARTSLEQTRRRILEIVPDADQQLSYGVPAFTVRGTRVAGLAAFTRHLSYLPHSGSVLPELAEQTRGYTQTRGSLHFPLDTPLPRALLSQLLAVRMRQAGLPVP